MSLFRARWTEPSRPMKAREFSDAAYSTGLPTSAVVLAPFLAKLGLWVALPTAVAGMAGTIVSIAVIHRAVAWRGRNPAIRRWALPTTLWGQVLLSVGLAVMMQALAFDRWLHTAQYGVVLGIALFGMGVIGRGAGQLYMTYPDGIYRHGEEMD
jgi:hypothetical protein